MIDVRKLRYNGKLNYQHGLSFYFKEHGRVISFYVDDIRTKKGKIKVTIYQEPNHGRPHIHIEEHDASIAIDTGELLAGSCDNVTRGIVKAWILRHKKDLQQLWEIVQRGGEYRPIVERIQKDKDYKDFGFKGEDPKQKTVIDGVIIWHDGDLIYEANEDGVIRVLCEGDMFVGLLPDYVDGSMVFDTIGGELQVRRLG